MAPNRTPDPRTPSRGIAAPALRKRYGAIRAVDGASFTVASGEIFGFLGPNGAGKRTAVTMLTTLSLPSGEAEVGLAVVKEAGAVRRSSGVAMQETGLGAKTPLELRSGWPAAAARLHPATHVLGAMRSLLNSGWRPNLRWPGLLASAARFVVFAFAVYRLRARRQRR